MKVCWASNAPWTGTGYGQQTAHVTSRLAADGHDVAIACNYGMQGASTRWQGIPILPMGWDKYSNDIIAGHASEHFGDDPGWLITLFDVWAFRNNIAAYQRHNIACWTPVDHLPVPAIVGRTLRDMGAVPIAMSQFGAAALERANLEPLYAPHGIDTGIFCPGDRAEGRDLIGIPDDAFVIGMNAANKGRDTMRKSFFEVFSAAAQLMDMHDDVWMYLHTEQFGMSSGVHLVELAAAVGIRTDRIVFVDQYNYRCGMSPTSLAKMYRAFDVLAAPSRGEGFGIPVIEAQACGIPVVVSNFSAQPELVGDGWMVQGEPDWDSTQMAAFFKPHIESIFDAFAAAYNQRTGEPSEKAVSHAAGYDADLVHERYWRPIMDQLADRLPSIEPVAAVPMNRAARRRRGGRS